MQRRILIAIVTIDRDSHLIERVYGGIEQILKNKNADLLIVCRETDVKCIDKWSKYSRTKIITVPHYNIIKRHNISSICNKRNIAINYAKEHNFDYLFFIDSDIIIKEGTLQILLDGCEKHGADICSIPYNIKAFGYKVIGVRENNKLRIIKITDNEKEGIKYEEGGGTMGCTLIKSKFFNVPFVVKNITIDEHFLYNEDWPFFVNVSEKGGLCLYVKNYNIEHLQN